MAGPLGCELLRITDCELSSLLERQPKQADQLYDELITS